MIISVNKLELSKLVQSWFKELRAHSCYQNSPKTFLMITYKRYQILTYCPKNYSALLISLPFEALF